MFYERQAKKAQSSLNSKVGILKHQLSSSKAVHRKEIDLYKTQIKQLTKERDDYKKKYLHLKREFDKVKHMLKVSEKVKLDQKALIKLQSDKLENLLCKVDLSRRNSSCAFYSADKPQPITRERSWSPRFVVADFQTPIGSTKRIDDSV